MNGEVTGSRVTDGTYSDFDILDPTVESTDPILLRLHVPSPRIRDQIGHTFQNELSTKQHQGTSPCNYRRWFPTRRNNANHDV